MRSQQNLECELFYFLFAEEPEEEEEGKEEVESRVLLVD
jgi:hypothetical protein